jgi:hemerythrin-like domain-containing protein
MAAGSRPETRLDPNSYQTLKMGDTSSEAAMQDLQDIVAGWREEHCNFGRALDVFEGQLERFQRGDAPDYHLMLDIMYYMTHYPDLFHHPEEELAFAQVGECEPAVRPVILELVKQHRSLRENGEELVEDLDGIVSGAISARERVETSGRTYVERLRSHIRKEEAELFPLVSRLLRDQDWAAIKRAVERRDDPLFGKVVWKQYRAIHLQIAKEAARESSE